VESFRAPRKVDDAIASFGSDAAATVESQLIATGILLPCQSEAEEMPLQTRKTPRRSLMLWRWPLLPARTVALLARPLAWLFAPRVVFSLGIIALLLHSCLVWRYGFFFPWRVVQSSVRERYYGIALIYLSLLCHELGHAAACMSYELEPGGIGVALYGFVPVFYSDVTRIWRLPQSGRVLVDAAGILGQAYFSVLCICVWVIWKWPPALICSYCMVASCVLNLNPFFRFDGYWIMVDILGVTRPLHEGNLYLRTWVKRLFRKGGLVSSPESQQYTQKLRTSLALYALCADALIVVGLVFVLAVGIPRLWSLDGSVIRSLLAVAHGRWDTASILTIALRLIFAGIASVGAALFVGRCAQSAGMAIWRLTQRTWSALSRSDKKAESLT
jgi:hypothetical protein